MEKNLASNRSVCGMRKLAQSFAHKIAMVAVPVSLLQALVTHQTTALKVSYGSATRKKVNISREVIFDLARAYPSLGWILSLSMHEPR